MIQMKTNLAKSARKRQTKTSLLLKMTWRNGLLELSQPRRVNPMISTTGGCWRRSRSTVRRRSRSTIKLTGNDRCLNNNWTKRISRTKLLPRWLPRILPGWCGIGTFRPLEIWESLLFSSLVFGLSCSLICFRPCSGPRRGPGLGLDSHPLKNCAVLIRYQKLGWSRELRLCLSWPSI